MTPPNRQHRPSARLLVMMPPWVGETVLALPLLRALRSHYPQAHITALARQLVRPVVEGCPWVDRIVTLRPPRDRHDRSRRGNPFRLARRLAAGHFDTAVILPNSFRWALLAKLARIPRRVGYERDGRGVLLTDRLLPRRAEKGFLPVPLRDYYLGIAAYLGATDLDPTLALFTRPHDDQRAADLLAAAGLHPAERPLVLIHPASSEGGANMWYPERFAAVADRCVRELGAEVALIGSPRERAMLDRVQQAAATPLADLTAAGLDLTLLKSVVRHARLVITNDTAPRHLAAASGVPVATIFGPTHPAWSATGFAGERQVRVPVYCGPCQKRRCPLRGTPDAMGCMRRIEPDMVFAAAASLLREAAGAPRPGWAQDCAGSGRSQVNHQNAAASPASAGREEVKNATDNAAQGATTSAVSEGEPVSGVGRANHR